jgi:hypothetical protein
MEWGKDDRGNPDFSFQNMNGSGEICRARINSGKVWREDGGGRRRGWKLPRAFHNSLLQIEYLTFFDSKLQSIVIPSSVEMFSQRFFYRCESLVSMTLRFRHQLKPLGISALAIVGILYL